MPHKKNPEKLKIPIEELMNLETQEGSPLRRLKIPIDELDLSPDPEFESGPGFGQLRENVSEAGSDIGGPRTVGAAGGSMMGFGLGGPPGAVIGAMLGAGSGEVSDLLGRYLTGQETPSLLESQRRVGQSMALEGFMDMAFGPMGGKLVGKLKQPLAKLMSHMVPFRRTVTEQGRRTVEFIERQLFPGEKAPVILPAATKSKILQWFAGFTQGSPLTKGLGQSIGSVKERAATVARQRAEELGRALGPEDLGATIKAVLDGSLDLAEANRLSLRKEIADRAASINNAEVLIPSDRINERITVIRKLLGQPKTAYTTEPTLTLREALMLEDEWSKIAFDAELGDKEARLAKSMLETVRSEIKDSLKSVDPSLYGELRAVDAVSGVEDAYIKRLVSRASSTAPDLFLESLFKDSRSTFYARNLMEALEGDPVLNKFRRSFYENFLDGATNESGEIVASKLRSQVKKLEVASRGSGVESLRTVLGDDEAKFLLDLADAMTQIKQTTEGGGGKVVAQLMLPGAVTTFTGGALTGHFGAGTVLAGTQVFSAPLIARVLTSPRAQRLLLRGVKLSPDSPAARQISARLMTVLTAQEMAEQQQDTLEPDERLKGTYTFGPNQEVLRQPAVVPSEPGSFPDSARKFLIKEEGKRSQVYTDAGGHETIGIGHKLTEAEKKRGKIRIGKSLVDFSGGLSDKQIDTLFEQDVRIAEQALERTPTPRPLTDKERAALVSFVYNVGIGNYQKSAVRRHLVKGEFDKVPAALQREWATRSGGRKLDSLVERRLREAKLFEE